MSSRHNSEIKMCDDEQNPKAHGENLEEGQTIAHKLDSEKSMLSSPLLINSVFLKPNDKATANFAVKQMYFCAKFLWL